MEFEKYIGSRREFYLHGPFHKTIHYGEMISVTLYRGNENKIYFFNEGADTVYWMDCNKQVEEHQATVKILPSDEFILNKKCDKLILSSRSATTTYFFNSAYPINSKDFVNHNLESWNLYTSIAKAVPLKIIFDNNELVLTSTATKVEQMKLEDKEFEVPKGYLKKK